MLAMMNTANKNKKQNRNNCALFIHFIRSFYICYYVFSPCHNAIAIHQHKLNDFFATGIEYFVVAVVSKTQL